MEPQPQSVTILTGLLKEKPFPTELNIAILNVPDDERDAPYVGGVRPDGSRTYPSAFAKVDVHLGLNAPDLPRLARDFRGNYYGLRLHLQGIDDDGSARTELRERILDATTCLLLVCPDNSTAWADRRRALLQVERDEFGVVSNRDGLGHGERDVVFELREELDFLNLLFTQHSKAPSSWAHRKWICRKVLSDILSLPHEPRCNELSRWAEDEVRNCTAVANLFPKNYYAWTHRSFVIKTLFDAWSAKFLVDTNDTKGVSEESRFLYSFLTEEVASIQSWLTRHVSDHSAAHYGAEALRLLLNFGLSENAYRGDNFSASPQDWGISVVERVLNLSISSLEIFMSHEVVWIWRRFCACLLLEVLCGKLGGEPSGAPIASNARMSLHRFVKHEVYDLFEKIAIFSSLDHNSSISEKKDITAELVHGGAYILWVTEHLKRYELHSDLENFNEVISISFKVKNDLSSMEGISHNMWRLNRNNRNFVF